MVRAKGARGHRVATMPVPREQVSRYGILAAHQGVGPTVTAHGIVEKPSPEDAPSTLAVVGRYVLEPEIFTALAHTAPVTGGEIQLTDAIAATTRLLGLTGVMFTGARYDCGSKDGLLAAIIARASQFREYDHVFADRSRVQAA